LISCIKLPGSRKPAAGLISGGLDEPQGVARLPDLNRIVVTNSGDGSCKIFDGTTYEPLAGAKFADDADQLRYDVSRHLIYVGCGDGAIGTIDALTNTRRKDSRPLFAASDVCSIGLFWSRSVLGMAKFRTVRATAASSGRGFVVARNPLWTNRARPIVPTNTRSRTAANNILKTFIRESSLGLEASVRYIHTHFGVCFRLRRHSNEQFFPFRHEKTSLGARWNGITRDPVVVVGVFLLEHFQELFAR